MNYSAEDYLNQLDVDKENLVDGLVSKGITCDNTETFTVLVPKVQGLFDSIFNKNITTNKPKTDSGYYNPSSLTNYLLSEITNFPAGLYLKIPEGVITTFKLLNDYKSSNVPKIIIPSTLTTLNLGSKYEAGSGFDVIVEGDFSNVTTVQCLISDYLGNGYNFSTTIRSLTLNNTGPNTCYLTDIASNLGAFRSDSNNKKWEQLTVNNIKVGAVTNMQRAFFGIMRRKPDNTEPIETIAAVKSLLTDIDTSACSSFYQCFAGIASAWSPGITDGSQNTQTFSISNWDLSHATTLQGMFYSCYLKTLTLENLSTPLVCNWDIFGATGGGDSYAGGQKTFIDELILNNIDFGPASRFIKHPMNGSKINRVTMTNCDTSAITDWNSCFQCTYYNYFPMIANWINNILPGLNTTSAVDMHNMFDMHNSNDRGLQEYQINFDFTQYPNFVTTNVTNMKEMFYQVLFTVYDSVQYPSSLVYPTLDVSTFDTHNVTNMAGMFRYCSCFKRTTITSYPSTYSYTYYPIIGVENLDTTNVTDMSDMFNFAQGAVHGKILHYDTSNVTNMARMFRNYWSIDDVGTIVSEFDTSKVTDFTEMFYADSKVTVFNLAHFTNDVSVTSFNVQNMFGYCPALTLLNISGLDLTKASNLNKMLGTGNEIVPTACTIVVKDTDSKTALQAVYPNHTNIYTAAEYAAL